MRKPDESWSDYYRRMRHVEDATAANRLADEQRMQFLRDLMATAIRVTDWEYQFIQSFLSSDPRSFSPGQRDAVDEMRDKYERQLKHFQSAKHSSAGQPISVTRHESGETPSPQVASGDVRGQLSSPADVLKS